MRKAVIGAGYSNGVAQDLSRAGAWLCTKGIDGAALLLDVLEQTANKPNVSVDGDGVYNFKDVCILSSGPSIIDILVSEAKESNEGHVELSNIYAPHLLIGLAANATKEFNVKIEILFSSIETITLSPLSLNFKDTKLQSGMDAVLKCSALEQTNTLKQDGKSSGEKSKARNPISIPESTIQALNIFAAKTYVPATEESRLAGAGAGLTDND